LHTDGDCYIGHWRDGLRQGYGKKIDNKGNVEEGFFENSYYDDKPKRAATSQIDFKKYGQLNL